jgi:hypothetical protein
MADAPRPAALPLVPLLLGGLVVIALVGAALSGLGGSPVAVATASPTATATATATLTVAGGSAWPVPATPSSSPTSSSSPTAVATPTPAIPRPAAAVTVQVCRSQHDGRCDHALSHVTGAFVVLVSFDASRRGDVLSIRLDGPGGRSIDGARLTLGGGQGAAWSSFRGGLARGSWTAVAMIDGVERARTAFTAG